MPYIGNQHNVGDHVNNFKVLDDISSHTATFDGSATSVVDTTNNTIRIPEHRFIQGQRVTYTNGGGGNIGGLTTGTAYFVSFDSANTIKLATTLANANSNTVINLSAVGSGTSHTLNVAFDGLNTKFKMTHGSGKAARLNNATQLNVAINNVIQRPNLDPNNFTDGFALEDNHKIVFKTAPTVNDIFWGSIIANTIENFDLRDNEVDNFTGDGSTTEFTLSTIPANNESVIVSINGVVQHPSDKNTARSYTLIDSILQFTAAPALGDGIQVRHIGFAGASTNDVSGFYGRTGNVALTSSDHITTGDITSRNINSSGIITATTFDGAFSSSVGGSNANFTGIVTAGVFKGGDIEGRNLKITGLSTFVGDASFSGNVSIGGTLTYEDVTNIDSVGIVTARTGLKVLAGGANVVGVVTASGADINGDLDVDGHTNLDNVSIVGVTTITGGNASVLYLESSNPTIRLTDTDSNVYSTIGGESGNLYLYTNSSGRDFIFRGSNEVARLTGDGYFGIGVNATNPGFNIVSHIGSNTAYSGSATNNTALAIGNVNSSANTNSVGIYMYSDGNGRGVVGLNCLSNSTGSSADFTIQTRHSGTLSEKFRISSTGKIGIGTDVAETQKLTIHGDSNYQAGIKLKQAGINQFRIMAEGGTGNVYYDVYGISGAANGDHIFRTKTSIGSVEALRINENGSVGINTNSPSGKLDISAAASTDMLMFKNGATNFARMGYNSSSGTAILDIRSEGHVSFLTNGNNRRFFITSGGQVNIGVTNSILTQTTYKFQVETDTNKKISFGSAAHDDLSNEGPGIFFSRQSDGSPQISGIFGHSNTSLAIAARDSLTFHAGGSSSYGSTPERLRIVSTGQVQLNGATGKSTTGTSATDLLMANGAAIRFRRANDSNWINTLGVDNSNNLKLGHGGSVDEIHFGIAGIGDTIKIDSSGRLHIGSFNNTGTNTKLVVGAGNNVNSTAIINTGDVDVDALTLSNWDGSTTTNKVIMHFDCSGIGGWNIGMPAATDAFVIEDDGGSEALRVNSSRSVIIGGVTSFGAAGSFSVGANGTFRSVLSSGTAQDTLIAAISGVSNGFQLTTDSSNNQTYKFHNGSTTTFQITSLGCAISSNIGIGVDNRWKIRPNSSNTELAFEYSTSTTLADNNIRMGLLAGGQVRIGNQESPSNYNGSADDIMLGSHSGSHGMTILSGTSNGGYIMFSDNNGGGSNAYRGQIEYQHGGSDADHMRFITASNERLRLKSNGNIVLGSDGTNSELTFTQDGTSGTQLNATTTGFGGYNNFSINSSTFVHKYGSNERFRINSDGALQIYGNGSSQVQSTVTNRQILDLKALGGLLLGKYQNTRRAVPSDQSRVIGMRAPNILDWGLDRGNSSYQAGDAINNFNATWVSYTINGSNTNNTWKLGQGPHGAFEWLWTGKSNETGNTGGQGGWNTSFYVDPNYTYMFITYVKRVSDSANGNWYVGTGGVGALGSGATSGLSNPYWTCGGTNNLSKDVWHVAVHYVRSYHSSNTNKLPNAGTYRMSDGSRIADGANCNVGNGPKFNTGSTGHSVTYRTYLFYASANDGTELHWAQPHAYKCDGSEPTLMEILGRELANNDDANNWDGSS